MMFRCTAASFRLAAMLVITGVFSSVCSAQSAILSEIYGRGVHAYHSGQYSQASEYFNMAISGGLKDPRVYYFRGLVAASAGRGYEAESDFRMGAELEATGGLNPMVGRSLARVQGSTRLKLEMIREKARLEALAMGAARSQARYGELGVTPSGAAPAPRGTIQPRAAAVAPRNATPPPPPAEGNPFQDDLDQEPVMEARDAFADAMGIAEQDSAAADTQGSPADAGAPAGGDPFGDAAAPADPFGGAGGGDDPFGAPAGGDDPFGF